MANGFKEWNKKAEDIFSFHRHNNINVDYSIDEAYPCSLNHLVNSHFMLLKLVNDANDTLGIIVGSYFATQVSLFNYVWGGGTNFRFLVWQKSYQTTTLGLIR